MKLGFIGAGAVAGAIARYAIAAGHEVTFASRNPEKGAALAAKLGKGALASSVKAAADCDLVFLAVPWPNIAEALAVVPDWSDKVLVDTTNPFAQTSPKLVLADLGGRSASEIVAGHAPGARQGVQLDHDAQFRAEAEKGRRTPRAACVRRRR